MGKKGRKKANGGLRGGGLSLKYIATVRITKRDDREGRGSQERSFVRMDFRLVICNLIDSGALT